MDSFKSLWLPKSTEMFTKDFAWNYLNLVFSEMQVISFDLENTIFIFFPVKHILRRYRIMLPPHRHTKKGEGGVSCRGLKLRSIPCTFRASSNQHDNQSSYLTNENWKQTPSSLFQRLWSYHLHLYGKYTGGLKSWTA